MMFTGNVRTEKRISLEKTALQSVQSTATGACRDSAAIPRNCCGTHGELADELMQVIHTFHSAPHACVTISLDCTEIW